jgi:hypothetical protein
MRWIRLEWRENLDTWRDEDLVVVSATAELIVYLASFDVGSGRG